MNPSTRLFSFLTILSIFISHATSQTSSPKLYQNVCKDIGKDEEQHCLKLLESNPEIVSAKDYLTLCRLHLQMAIEKSSKAQESLKNLMNKYPSSQSVKECATTDYDKLINSFKNSLALLVKDPNTAKYNANIARNGPLACELRVMVNEKNIDIISSISRSNNETIFLSVVAKLAINHLT
ncbi:uncharacterized protein LOC123896342 [Trifolium pratense]|uniref:uncharacterized protein LOC123896342 n=1 Tax=Trifolium pratense TaxID=57577 RepID=UPI001E6910FE|nr:uncharacterized protein LOC123896342 [Trifolium pratense]